MLDFESNVVYNLKKCYNGKNISVTDDIMNERLLRLFIPYAYLYHSFSTLPFVIHIFPCMYVFLKFITIPF